MLDSEAAVPREVAPGGSALPVRHRAGRWVMEFERCGEESRDDSSPMVG
jgi:hypothetical protein